MVLTAARFRANLVATCGLWSNEATTGVRGALEQIKAIYAIEEHIREHHLVEADKQLYRLIHSKPKVEVFFDI